MNAIATSGQVMANAGMYWIVSVAWFMLLDMYAAKKIGKQFLGYKILRVPRFFCLIFVSVITILVIVLSCWVGVQVSYSWLSYLGLPYFVSWVFFLVNVLRRVRAETEGKPR